MISTVIFDIGGVFIHSPIDQIKAIAAEHHLTTDEVHKVMYEGSSWDAYKRGKITPELYWSEIMNALPAHFDGRSELFRERLEETWYVDRGLQLLANQLKQKYRIAALSNADPFLESRLERAGLMQLFELVINSCRVEMAKPDDEIYIHTVKMLGVTPEECLFVDDKMRNTVAADRLGFRTHIYKDSESFADFITRMGLLSERSA